MSRMVQVLLDRHKNKLLGRRIVDVRYMTSEESQDQAWGYRAAVLVLDDGMLLYPASDAEQNDAGSLCVQTPAGETITLPGM